MRAFSTVDLFFMVKELQILIGGRIEKVYQTGNNVYISIYVSTKGKKLLRILPDKLWITKHKPEFNDLPDFAECLRRFLNNARIKEIIQIDSERIIKITTEKADSSCFLYFEFFGKGNIILEKDNKIKAALTEKKWKDRTIRRGLEYQPPVKTINSFKITKNYLQERQSEFPEFNISKILATAGFGKDYAIEICERAHVDYKSKIVDLDKIVKVIKEVIESDINPQVFYVDDKPFMAVPIPFISQKNKSISTKTFSSAIEIVEDVPASRDIKQEEKDKYCRIISKQEDELIKLGKKSEEYKKKAEFIYEKYAEFKDILEKIKNKEIPENVDIDWKRKKVKIKL